MRLLHDAHTSACSVLSGTGYATASDGEAQTVAASRPNLTRPLAYPPALRGPVVDTLHGQAIADPYRWLEDLGSAPQPPGWRRKMR